MTRLALALLLAACPPAAAQTGTGPDAPAPDAPTYAAYSLGGLMSGPYRASADLARGVATEAAPPRGVRGDGAGQRTASLPVTRTRPLPPREVQALRALAAAVWERGAQSSPSCVGSVDALGMIEVTRAGATRLFQVSIPCMNAEAKALSHALRCAANPGGGGCEVP